MEDDLILGGEEQPSDIDIIENQLYVIINVVDIPDDMYDDCPADKIKCVTNAMRIIQKIQRKTIKEIP